MLRNRRAVRIVASSAFNERMLGVGMNLDELLLLLLMAIKATTFEAKSAPPTQTVTLGALDVRYRRMVLKHLELLRCILPYEEPYLFPPAFPDHRQRMFPGVWLNGCVEYILERLLRFDGLAVKLQFPAGSLGNYINLARCMS